MLDRLLHRSVVINLDGESYRRVLPDYQRRRGLPRQGCAVTGPIRAARLTDRWQRVERFDAAVAPLKANAGGVPLAGTARVGVFEVQHRGVIG